MQGARDRVGSGRLGIIGVALASFVIFGLAIPSAPVRGQATVDWVEAVFPERTHNFGTVARGSILRHTFRITNRTNREVRIIGFKPKCGCTDITIGSKTIPPGAQTTLEAVFDTTKYRGYKASGLTLQLDQPSVRTIDYDLACFIQDEVEIDPGVIDFGEVKRGAAAEKVVALRYLGGQREWRVLDMRHAHSALTAELQEVSRSKSGDLEYRLVASLDPKRLENGNFRDEIVLVTNDPQRRSIPISVAAKVTSEVSLSPAVLNLGPVKAGSKVERTVLLRGPSPFRVTESEAVKGTIAVSGDLPDSSKPMHQIKVVIETPEAAPGGYHAILELQTDHPNEPPVRLTAFATVTP